MSRLERKTQRLTTQTEARAQLITGFVLGGGNVVLALQPQDFNGLTEVDFRAVVVIIGLGSVFLISKGLHGHLSKSVSVEHPEMMKPITTFFEEHPLLKRITRSCNIEYPPPTLSTSNAAYTSDV